MVIISISKRHFKCVDKGTYSYKDLASIRFEKCDSCEYGCWRWRGNEKGSDLRQYKN